jgi:phytoene/squalene synthetase
MIAENAASRAPTQNAASRAPTRDAGSENFPVASRLLAPEMRPKVMGFYRFVRTADDIADDPALSGEEKLRRLGALEAALEVEDEATQEQLADVGKLGVDDRDLAGKNEPLTSLRF